MTASCWFILALIASLSSETFNFRVIAKKLIFHHFWATTSLENQEIWLHNDIIIKVKLKYTCCKSRSSNNEDFCQILSMGSIFFYAQAQGMDNGYGKPMLKKLHLNLLWIKSYRQFFVADFLCGSGV